MTDINGNVVATYTYEAFGNLIKSTGNIENNYLFAGEQFDENLEQYYLRDRYYDQGIGRFTRRDTYEGRINEPVTRHKYLYANGNPVNGIDPSGYFTLTEVLVGSATIGAITGAVGGGYYGYRDSGELFSQETLKFALIGAVGGATAGALLGGSIYLTPAGLGPIIQTGARQLFRKAMATHSRSQAALLAGFGLGFTGGILEPDYEVALGTAFTTALAIGDDVLVRGAIWRRNAMTQAFGELYTANRAILFRYVQSTTFLTLHFLFGFTVGYTSGSFIRNSYDQYFSTDN